MTKIIVALATLVGAIAMGGCEAATPTEAAPPDGRSLATGKRCASATEET